MVDENYLYSESSPDEIPATESVFETAKIPVDGEDVLLNQLSGRMGSLQIAEDGQLRFYGATSNLHILHNGPLSLSRSRFRSPADEGTDLLIGAGVGQFVDSTIEDHLLKLYFTWEEPSIHVVEESVLLARKEKLQSCRPTKYIVFRSTNECHVSKSISKSGSDLCLTCRVRCSIGATMTTKSYSHLPDQLPDFLCHEIKASAGT